MTDDATIELANIEEESAAFINSDKVIRINSTLFDKTWEADSIYSIRLGEACKSMAVMTGDTIRAKVHGK